MSGFSADWLALREPFDVRARAPELADSFLADIPTGALVADLGSGAGSNIAFLRARGGDRLRWRHVDADPALIEAAEARFRGIDTIEFAQIDLARSLPAALDGVAGVTCAALIDLVSAAWIDGFVDALRRLRIPALIVLTYDGRMEWSPRSADDAILAEAFHRDMRRDKGFGPALGPAAAHHLAARLREAGALLETRDSDWRIAGTHVEMSAAMRDGIGEAAARSATAQEQEAVARWRAARAAQRRLGLIVGHQDIAARWA
jgi:SAM-dependent methyltransferase